MGTSLLFLSQHVCKLSSNYSATITTHFFHFSTRSCTMQAVFTFLVVYTNTDTVFYFILSMNLFALAPFFQDLRKLPSQQNRIQFSCNSILQGFPCKRQLNLLSSLEIPQSFSQVNFSSSIGIFLHRWWELDEPQRRCLFTLKFFHVYCLLLFWVQL